MNARAFVLCLREAQLIKVEKDKGGVLERSSREKEKRKRQTKRGGPTTLKPWTVCGEVFGSLANGSGQWNLIISLGEISDGGGTVMREHVFADCLSVISESFVSNDGLTRNRIIYI